MGRGRQSRRGVLDHLKGTHQIWDVCRRATRCTEQKVSLRAHFEDIYTASAEKFENFNVMTNSLRNRIATSGSRHLATRVEVDKGGNIALVLVNND